LPQIKNSQSLCSGYFVCCICKVTPEIEWFWRLFQFTVSKFGQKLELSVSLSGKSFCLRYTFAYHGEEHS
ncbi:hypothetical protein OFO29_36625, partial [Escherichia coli]|nr:hypothetical protein [Escherichia coli]